MGLAKKNSYNQAQYSISHEDFNLTTQSTSKDTSQMHTNCKQENLSVQGGFRKAWRLQDQVLTLKIDLSLSSENLMFDNFQFLNSRGSTFWLSCCWPIRFFLAKVQVLQPRIALDYHLNHNKDSKVLRIKPTSQ
ncbi:hypothetical protein MRB53_008264 [Persea americana]|uniref:Uncharacterized protein n=1 Tax=Persea americana TaxID=3435 RepID=A0ACC2MLK2_PERAE|nr:hypothetical protein MRB53_008264 [Persea americana]